MKLVLQMIIFSGLYHVQCPKEAVGRSRKRDRIKAGSITRKCAIQSGKAQMYILLNILTR